MNFDWLLYFWLLLKASLVSSSGTGNVPILHADLIPRGWATEQQFAEALAVGQISPGPTGLWVISLGYLTAGWRGSLLAALAIMLPPLGVLLVDRVHRAIGDHPAVRGFVGGLTLAVTGIFVVVLFDLFRAGGGGYREGLIALAALLLAASRRVPVVAILGLAAGVGILLYR